MKIYCYKLPPIDFWEGAMTGGDLLSTMRTWRGDLGAVIGYLSSVDELERSAQDGFRELHWEGDIREGPYYFAVPGEADMIPGYALKQDNNGTTFVACTVELPHLDELAFERLVVER